MKRKSKIVIVIVGSLLTIALLFIAAYCWFLSHLFNGILGPPPKPPIGVIGQAMASDTQSSYDFLCKALGLTFPKGTQIDVYDTGFDLLVACFTLSKNDFPKFVEYNLRMEHSSDPIELQSAMNLSKQNQSIPKGSIMMTLQKSSEWEYPIFIYVEQKSGRIWIECHYRSWFD